MRTEKQDIIKASIKFKEYGSEKIQDIVGFLADQAGYIGELSYKELADKMTNITENTYNEDDFKQIDYLGRHANTPFSLVFVTMMYWVKINHINLARLDKSIKDINRVFLNKLEQRAESSENAEKVKEALDKMFYSQINSPLTLLCKYNPDRNRIDALFSDKVVADLEKKKFKFNLISSEVMDEVVDRLMFIASTIDIVGLEEFSENIQVIDLDYYLKRINDPLNRNILRLIDAYPCLTENEIVEIIINGFDNNEIASYLRLNTLRHRHSLKAWDKYQYAEDSEAINIREALLNRQSEAYKNLDDVNNVSKEDIVKSLEKMIDEGIIIHMNPLDEFEPPYIIETHESKYYLALNTDLIYDARCEMNYKIEKACNENFFTQFLK